MAPDPLKEVFIFLQRMCDARTTPLYQLTAMPHMRTEETTLNDSKEASLCYNSLVFLLNGVLHNYKSGLLLQARDWLVERKYVGRTECLLLPLACVKKRVCVHLF